MSTLDPQTRAVVRALDALTAQVQRLADAQPPAEGTPLVRDDSAPNLLRVLVDRAARGVLNESEGEALRRRTEQMIAGRETWKANAEEIEQDRDDWRRRAEAMERAMESTAADALKHRGCHRDLMAQCLRAERAEAVIERVRALADRWDLDAPPPGNRPLTDLRAALDGIEQPTTEAP